MSSTASAWALQAVLSVLQGEPSVGQVTVRSTSASGTLPAHSIGVPIVDGELHPEAAVQVLANPATADHSWPVVIAGTAVSVASVQAGVRVNLAAATQVRWSLPIAGIEEVSALAAGGLTGGTQLDVFGALRQIRTYKDLGSRPAAAEFFAAQLTDFPAAALAWMRTTPADGASTPALGPSTSRVGRGRRLFKHDWTLYLVTSRLDSGNFRTREGEQLRDAVLDVLSDRSAFRGMTVSGPQGLEILSADVLHVTPTSYVDAVRFTTTYTQQRRSIEPPNWADWLKTRLVVRSPVAQPGPADELDHVDITIDMT
jgi:hypothetical protein